MFKFEKIWILVIIAFGITGGLFILDQVFPEFFYDMAVHGCAYYSVDNWMYGPLSSLEGAAPITYCLLRYIPSIIDSTLVSTPVVVISWYWGLWGYFIVALFWTFVWALIRLTFQHRSKLSITKRLLAISTALIILVISMWQPYLGPWSVFAETTSFYHPSKSLEIE